MKRATRADVAKAAGVAPSTVSLVLSGRGPELGIAEATMTRVRDAAEQLHYVPRAAARAMRQMPSKVIGLIMAQLPEDPFVPVVQDILVEAVASAQRHGYFVIPIAEPAEGRSDYEYVHRIVSQIDLAGVVCETTSRQPFISPLLESLGLPVVWLSMINIDNPPPGQQHVMIDEKPGVQAIVDRLDVAKDAEVLYLSGPKPRFSRHLPVAEAFQGRFTRVELTSWAPDIAEVMGPLQQASPQTTVIWCANDTIAIAALQVAQLLQRRVPEDWSIIGFGNEEPFSAAVTGLTSTVWPLRDFTRIAIDQLIAAIESPIILENTFIVPTTACIRSSAKIRTESL